MADYRIVIQPEAESNIATTHAWIAARSPEGAERWYHALERAIQRLKADPERFPIAADSCHFDVVIRNLTFRMVAAKRMRVSDPV